MKALALNQQLANCKEKVRLSYTDNSFEAVKVSKEMHFVDLDTLFAEVSRVLVPGGKFHLDFPHLNSNEAFFIWGGHFFSEKWFRENLVFNQHFEIKSVVYRPSSTATDLPVWLRLFPKKVLGNFLMNIYSGVEVSAVNRKSKTP